MTKYTLTSDELVIAITEGERFADEQLENWSHVPEWTYGTWCGCVWTLIEKTGDADLDEKRADSFDLAVDNAAAARWCAAKR